MAKKGFKSTSEMNVNRVIESNLKYSQSVLKMMFDFIRAYIHEEYAFQKALSPEERAEMRKISERIQTAAKKSDAELMKTFGKGVKFITSSFKEKLNLIWNELKNPEELKTKIDLIVSNVKLFYRLQNEIQLAELEEEIKNRVNKDELKLKLIEADNNFALAQKKLELEHERALKKLEEEESYFDPDSRAEPKTTK